MKITAESVAAMTQKVFIALPQGELGRYSDFEATFERVICPPYTIRQRLFGIYIANLQNALARMFLQTDCEWFWLVNDDQIYTADTLIRLLEHDKDLVVPMCLEKKAPHCPLVYERPEAGLHHPYRFLRKGERGLIPIGAAGGGGMLIHRRVFEAIPDPWWTVTTGQTETGVWEQSSEDFDFCTKVHDAGFRMFCDLEVSAVHIAQYGIRAMVDESTGEWRTVLLRGDEQIVLPCAAAPEPVIQVRQNIKIPDFNQWKRAATLARS